MLTKCKHGKPGNAVILYASGRGNELGRGRP
jgi:hypothetical protein